MLSLELSQPLLLLFFSLLGPTCFSKQGKLLPRGQTHCRSGPADGRGALGLWRGSSPEMTTISEFGSTPDSRNNCRHWFSDLILLVSYIT